ncbi:MAG TPA: hypothetical protein VFN22_06800 [Gemmatimonadales bacterium]|nr:hypothetical protein [Gemmatimonadales bacterium]
MRRALTLLALAAIACGGDSTGPGRGDVIPSGSWRVREVGGTAPSRDYRFTIVSATSERAIIDWTAGAMVRPLPARDTLLPGESAGTFSVQFDANPTRLISFEFSVPSCTGSDLTVFNDAIEFQSWPSCSLGKMP